MLYKIEVYIGLTDHTWYTRLYEFEEKDIRVNAGLGQDALTLAENWACNKAFVEAKRLKKTVAFHGVYHTQIIEYEVPDYAEEGRLVKYTGASFVDDKGHPSVEHGDVGIVVRTTADAAGVMIPGDRVHEIEYEELEEYVLPTHRTEGPMIAVVLEEDLQEHGWNINYDHTRATTILEVIESEVQSDTLTPSERALWAKLRGIVQGVIAQHGAEAHIRFT